MWPDPSLMGYDEFHEHYRDMADNLKDAHKYGERVTRRDSPPNQERSDDE